MNVNFHLMCLKGAMHSTTTLVSGVEYRDNKRTGAPISVCNLIRSTHVFRKQVQMLNTQF